MTEFVGSVRRMTTRTQDIGLDDAGIIWCVLRRHSNIDLDEAQRTIATIRELARGARRPVLVDMREATSITREARHYFAGPDPGTVALAAAFIVSSPISRAIANFFMGLNKPAVPSRVFDDVKAGYEWLRGMFP